MQTVIIFYLNELHAIDVLGVLGHSGFSRFSVQAQRLRGRYQVFFMYLPVCCEVEDEYI